MGKEVFSFGSFRLDAGRRALFRGERPVPLTPRAFDVLQYLVTHPDRVVEKDELIRAVWPDVTVSDANLTQAVSTLRRVLGDSPGEHQFVATVPRRGYCFVSEVAQEAQAPPHERRTARGRRRDDRDGWRRWASSWGVPLALVVLATTALQLLRRR